MLQTTNSTYDLIDLHGLRVQQAKGVVQYYLAKAARCNKTRIRFVTGRGNHVNSNGTRGVLFKTFNKWVKQSAFKDRIEKCEKHTGFYEVHFKPLKAKNIIETTYSAICDQVIMAEHDAIKKAAEEGDSSSQLIYASMLEEGEVVPQNFKLAFSFYKKSAQQGCAIGMHQTARCYLHGLGTILDDKQANHWLTQADEAGVLESTVCLAEGYASGRGMEQPDERRALSLFAKAAARGNTYAMRTLGLSYYEGILTLIKDRKKGFEWYKRAADLGDPIAQYNVAVEYNNGQVVRRDLAQAFKYARRSAKNGDPDGQRLLGQIYLLRGSEKEKIFAYEWLSKAADAGSCYSASLLRRIDPNGKGKQYAAKAAEGGDILALMSMQSIKTDEEYNAVVAKALHRASTLTTTDIVLLEETSCYFLIDEMLLSQQDQHQAKALAALQLMAEANYLFALRRLTRYAFAKLLYGDDTWPKIVSHLEQSVTLDDTKTMIQLGYYYQTGQHVLSDLTRAKELYTKAAALHNPTGAFMLANQIIYMSFVQKNELDLDEIRLQLTRAIELEKQDLRDQMLESGLLDSYQRVSAYAELLLRFVSDLSHGINLQAWVTIYSEHVMPFIAKHVVEGIPSKEPPPPPPSRLASPPIIKDVHFYKMQGNHLVAQGDYDGALSYYEKAIRLDQSIAAVWLNKGLMHKKLNDFTAALSAFERALVLEPGYYKARFNKADILRQQGHSAEATALYEVLLIEKPNDKSVQTALVQLRSLEAEQAPEEPSQTSTSLWSAWSCICF